LQEIAVKSQHRLSEQTVILNRNRNAGGGRISESLFSNFSFDSNTSLMSTDVKVDPTKQGNELENGTNRKLQGASKLVGQLEFQTRFRFEKIGKNSMTLVYNVYGDQFSQ
jgi:hypothetical protein